MERYRLGGSQRDIRSEEIGIARFGFLSTLPLRVQLKHIELSVQLRQTQRELVIAYRRLNSMNRFFWLKAAELPDYPEAVSLLARLHEHRKLPHSEIDLSTTERAVALALLTGAHLVEATYREAWITPQGEDFYRRVLDDQTPNSSEAILDQP